MYWNTWLIPSQCFPTWPGSCGQRRGSSSRFPERFHVRCGRTLRTCVGLRNGRFAGHSKWVAGWWIAELTESARSQGLATSRFSSSTVTKCFACRGSGIFSGSIGWSSLDRRTPVETEPRLTASQEPVTATKAVLTTAATNAVLALVALATGILAARLLGPEGRGLLAAAVAVGTLVGAIGALALGEALVFFVGRQIRPSRVVLRTAALIATGSTVLLIAVAWVVMPIALAGQPAAIDGARAYAFIGLPFVLVGFPVTFIRALQRYGLWNVLRLLSPLCWLAALTFFTVNEIRAVVPLVITFVVLQLLLAPLVWWLAHRQRPSEDRVDLALVKPMLRYGAPLLLATLPLALNLRLDQLLIANWETAEQLGLYAVSVSWAGLGVPLMAAIGSVLFPKLAAMDPSDARASLARSSRAGVIIAIVIATISGLSAPTLVPLLFGPSFAVPIVLPLLLAVATSVLGLNGIIEEGLRGLGEPRSVLVGELAGLLVMGVLLFVLVPRAGITGAALASLGGYAMVTATLASRLRICSQVRVSDLLIPRGGDLRDMVQRAGAIARVRGGIR